MSALALVAALAVDPLAAEAPMPAPQPVAPATRPGSDIPPVAHRPSASRAVVSTGLDGGVVLGLFPIPAPTVSTFVDVHLERDSVLSPSARLSLAAAISPSVSVPPGSARFRWAAGLLDGCPFDLRLASALHLVPCALVEVGVLAGSGADVPTPVAESRRWVAVGGSARLKWSPIGSFFFEAYGRLEAPLSRDTFVFALPERVVVHAVPAFVGSFGLGAGVRWP